MLGNVVVDAGDGQGTKHAISTAPSSEHDAHVVCQICVRLVVFRSIIARILVVLFMLLLFHSEELHARTFTQQDSMDLRSAVQFSQNFTPSASASRGT